MSWINRLENTPFKITTGDGKEYTPLWKNGEKSKTFNTTKYDFINVSKSFIDRKKEQSNKYPLVFWFQGEDNIEQTDVFEESANDNRAWTIEHPFYGTIKGQPTNLKRNDTNYNVTEVTVDFWESITDDFPNSQVSVRDEVASRTEAINLQSLGVVTGNGQPATSDIDLVRSNAALAGSKFSPDSENFNGYVNTVQNAVKNANTLVTDTEAAYTDAQAVLSVPAGFDIPVQDRVASYAEAYQVVKASIGGVFSKLNFESQGSSIISGICFSCLNPLEGDYVTRTDIEEVNTTLFDVYNDYLQTLDGASVDIYDVENYWRPNVGVQTSLNELVYFTANALFSLSFNARQERTVELSEDSNLIVLTHRYLGLDSEDRNIELFKQMNDIKGSENFKLRKGRTIKYFV